MSDLPTPEKLQLSPQEWRVYAALHVWCDKFAIARAINDPSGQQRYTPPAIILSKLRKKLKPHGLEIIAEGKRGKLQYCVRKVSADRVAVITDGAKSRVERARA